MGVEKKMDRKNTPTECRAENARVRVSRERCTFYRWPPMGGAARISRTFSASAEDTRSVRLRRTPQKSAPLIYADARAHSHPCVYHEYTHARMDVARTPPPPLPLSPSLHDATVPSYRPFIPSLPTVPPPTQGCRRAAVEGFINNQNGTTIHNG